LAWDYFVRLVTTLLSERQTKEQLATAHEQLRQYALQIEDAAVQERNHIAREIHDFRAHAHRSKYSVANGNEALAMRSWQYDLSRAGAAISC